ncbi:MAG: 4-hydroxy-tetrahydrodipicolinate synthase [Deltaproteobacteria bacterium]|nr:4-hydroxy-tetrahydrodipicolinate synthase [Deltaproteobacteria bacterium]
MSVRFPGTLTALITPFRDGAIDHAALEKIVDDQIANGSNGLVPCGSTGESATLSHDEHIEVIKLVVARAARRVPVIAGTGSNSTAEAIRLTEGAKRAGADAALLISPYYNRPTQDGIYRHYRAIAEATRFPLIVYNIPGRTASKIEALTLERLCEVDEIVGIKEATGSLDEVQEVIRRCGDRLPVYAGDDVLTLPIIAVGGIGVISVVGNLVPQAWAQAVDAMVRGDWHDARCRHYALLPLMRVLFLETNPIPIKAAMAMRGLCRDELRMPLLPMTEGPRAVLRQALVEAGLL